MPRYRNMYFSDDFEKDIQWARTEYPADSLSAILQKALHELRTRIEKGRIETAAGETTAEDRTTAADLYKKKFDFIADYNSDSDLIEVLGYGKIRELLTHRFREIEKERPQILDLCRELLKQEHPRLYKIWKT